MFFGISDIIMELLRWFKVGSIRPSLPSFLGQELSVLQDFYQLFCTFLFHYEIVEVFEGYFPLPKSPLIPRSRTKCFSGLLSDFLDFFVNLGHPRDEQILVPRIWDFLRELEEIINFRQVFWTFSLIWGILEFTKKSKKPDNLL